jgi:hypothetical protein
MAARNWHREQGFGCRGSSKHRNRGAGHAGGLSPRTLSSPSLRHRRAYSAVSTGVG